ncbi:MAG TPA: hypothetical protein EYG79_04995 [Rhodobacteraceae bacterium]|nr:hypothetical protein [Paracoccaceae bacterium]
MRFILAFLTLFSLPLHAQELLPEYQVLGHIDLVMEGEEDRRFPIVATADRSFANKYELSRDNGIFKIRLAGVTPSENGHWEFPMIAIDITTHEIELFRSIYITYSTESFRNDYTFRASTEDQTAVYGDLVEGENGLVEFEFRGQLVHFDVGPETRISTPQAGKAPVEISGRVSVIIPAEYRED